MTGPDAGVPGEQRNDDDLLLSLLAVARGRADQAETELAAARRTLDEIVSAFNEHGHVPPVLSPRQHDALMAARSFNTETATRRRRCDQRRREGEVICGFGGIVKPGASITVRWDAVSAMLWAVVQLLRPWPRHNVEVDVWVRGRSVAAAVPKTREKEKR